MARSTASVGRRRFLKGAAVGAAALVARGAPVAGEAQEPTAARPATPAAPGNAQLRADTEPPPRDVSARLVEKPASDFMVDVIKSLGIEYVAANPGSSFEGLHESIINYGDNRMPELLTCCHEESSVAMAHGYAKIEGKPMLAIVHGNIGLQHASMAVYNAYADRVPVMIIAGNWRDAGTRANGVNSYHSAQDMALIVRDYVKWDDEPASLPAFAESAVRAYKIAMTPPMEPVLLVVDHDLQLRSLNAAPKIPRLVVPSPPAGDAGAVREAARLLVAAENPRINAGRAARTPNGIALLVELAELLQAAVNGGGDRVNFPSRHPLAGAGSGAADVTLNLEVQGGGGAGFVAARAAANAKTINISALGLFIKSNLQDFQHMVDADVDMAADSEATLPLLIDEVKRQLSADRTRVIEDRGTQDSPTRTATRDAGDGSGGVRLGLEPDQSGAALGRAVGSDQDRRLVAGLVAGVRRRLARQIVEFRQTLPLHRWTGCRRDGLRRAGRRRRGAREPQAWAPLDQHPDRRRLELCARRAVDGGPPQDPAAHGDAQQSRLSPGSDVRPADGERAESSADCAHGTTLRELNIDYAKMGRPTGCTRRGPIESPGKTSRL